MNNELQIGPDYVRLSLRYEVPNGAHEVNSTQILARAMSYACVIGATPEIIQIIREREWPI